METITSRKNELVIRLKALGADGAFRRAEREFVCDGAKLLDEAVRWGAEIRAVLCLKDTILPPLPTGARVCVVPKDILCSVSQLKTPHDAVFSCVMPEPETYVDAPAIVLENVQDPGNVGTVLRTADAFGISVALVGACADPYSPKTVRATMGAVFRSRIAVTDAAGLRAALGDTPLFGAALGEKSRDIGELELKGAAVAIGSEGSGLSDELLSMCAERVIIPMSPRCESLNAAVAAAVFMWEMRK